MDYFLYSLIAPATLVVLILVLGRTWRYRANRQASILLVAIILNIGWLVVNYLELVFIEPCIKITFAKANYLFAGSVCVMWAIFTLRYTGRERFVTPWRVVAAFIPWIISVVLVFSNEQHHLIWHAMRFKEVGYDLVAMRILSYGPAFWPLVLYNWGLMLVGFALLLNKFFRSSPLFRMQTIWILAGVALPLVFNLIYVLRLIPGLMKDYTPVAFGFGISLLVISVLRFNLFNLAPVARETLVDQMGDGMLVLDNKRHVVDNNPAASRLLDQPLRMAGCTAEEVFPDLQNFESHLPRQANLPVEIQYNPPSGRTLKMRIWGLSDENTQASGWLIIIEDVSAAQQALADLRKSEELFRTIVQSAHEGVAILDMQGKITYASPRLMEMFGNVLNRDWVDRPAFGYIDAEDVPRASADLQRLVSGEKSIEDIFKHQRRDGSNFFSETSGGLLREPNGNPYGILLLVRDISARLKAEAERMHMAQILQTVIDNEHIILVIVDENDQLSLWNKGAEKIIGYPAGEVIGNPHFLECLHPDGNYREYMNEIRHHIRNDEMNNLQVELYARSGEKKFIAMFSQNLRDEQGKSIGIVSVGVDITSRIQAEQVMQSMNSNLEVLISQRTQQLQDTVRQLQEEIQARRHAESELVATQENLANRLAEQSRQLAALYEVILTGGQSMEWQALLDSLLDKILAVTFSAAGAIYQLNPEHKTMDMVAQHGIPADSENELLKIANDEIVNSTCPSIKGMTVCLSAAIHLSGSVTGVLRVWRDSSTLFSIEEVAIMQALADQVGIIMENARLRSLIQQTAAEDERRRLARNLHDSVTQSLHSLTWLTDVALNRIKLGDSTKLQQSLYQINDSARQALKEMRLLLYESILQASAELPLVEALNLRLESVEERAGLQTQLEIGEVSSWPHEWETELFAIATEALNNALKYARASQIIIRLRGGNTWCEMEIEDNGIGFDPQHIPGGGMGMRIMRERAAALGGNLQIDSTLNQGTCIHITIGKNPEPPAQKGD